LNCTITGDEKSADKKAACFDLSAARRNRGAFWNHLSCAPQELSQLGQTNQNDNPGTESRRDLRHGRPAQQRFLSPRPELEPIPRPAFSFPGAWFRLGTNQELHLIANLRSPFFASHENNHFALRVDNLDPWEQHLKDVGADFAPRKPRPDGASQVFLRDPDGHVIELFTPPA
jgi:lactoylglutathione lyase